MKNNTQEDCYNVPLYIEKAIKKLYKVKNQETELALQIKDYMETHNIPKTTPLHLLKFFPNEEDDPNQMKLDFGDN